MMQEEMARSSSIWLYRNSRICFLISSYGATSGPEGKPQYYDNNDSSLKF